MLFLGMLYIPMKSNKLKSLYTFLKSWVTPQVVKEVPASNQHKERTNNSDEVRVLNFSALKVAPVEVEVLSIQKNSEDEYGLVFVLETFIKTSGFDDNLSIHVHYHKDWYTKEIVEQCHMFGVDCVYNYNDPIFKKYESLPESVRRKICSLVQNNLSYSELQKLIEKQRFIQLLTA